MQHFEASSHDRLPPRSGSRLRTRTATLLVAAACAAWALSPGESRAVDAPINSTHEGQYDSTGFNQPSNSNYLVAWDVGGTEYRNFFVFEIPATTDVVVAATLNLYNPAGGFGSIDPTETYEVHDVSTPIADLDAGGSGKTTIFEDLGTGVLFGKAKVSNADNNAVVHVPMNAAFLSLAQAGGTIAVGGDIGTIDHHPNASEQIFASTFNIAGQLNITTAQFQPDLIINDVGDNVYDARGKHESVDVAVNPGKRSTFIIHVQNEANAIDDFTIKGASSSTPFVVHYLQAGADVTADVEAGTFKLKQMAPKESRTIRMKIKARKNATVDDLAVFRIKATSNGSADNLDVVKATVHVAS